MLFRSRFVEAHISKSKCGAGLAVQAFCGAPRPATVAFGAVGLAVRAFRAFARSVEASLSLVASLVFCALPPYAQEARVGWGTHMLAVIQSIVRSLRRLRWVDLEGLLVTVGP